MTIHPRSRRSASALLLTSAVAGAGLLAGAGGAAAAVTTTPTVADTCEATALSLSLLGSAAVTANHAGSPTAACVGDSGSLDLSALGAVTAKAVQAVTTSTPKARTTATASATVADLNVGSSLVAGTLTNALTSGPNSLTTSLNSAVAPLIGPGGAITTLLAPLSGLGVTVAGVNSGTLLGSAATDLPAALDASLPNVLGAALIQANASIVPDATCGGAVTFSGSTNLTGVTVLGSPVGANETVARTISLDTQALSLSDLVSVNDVLKSITVQVATTSPLALVIGAGQHSLYEVLTAPSGGLLGTLNGLLPVGTTLSSLLGTLNSALEPVISGTEITLPTGLLSAVITPQAVSRDAKQLTETALSVSVSALGQPVLSGALAQARVSGTTKADVDDCVAIPVKGFGDPADPSSDPRFPSGFAERALQCTDVRLRLLDVRRSGGRTYVQGVAETQYVGSTATIYLAAGKKKVGTAKVGANGAFSTKVALPASKIRNTSKARYYAILSGDRTNALKFARRMEVTKLVRIGDKVTFQGRTSLPRASRQKAVKIQERVTCSKYRTIATAKPSPNGRFSITFKQPTSVSSGVYRAFTQVPTTAPSRKLKPTYTLPRLLSFAR